MGNYPYNSLTAFSSSLQLLLEKYKSDHTAVALMLEDIRVKFQPHSREDTILWEHHTQCQTY